MVAVFPQSPTADDFNAFLDAHAYVPSHTGRGFDHRAGIGAVIKRGIRDKPGTGEQTGCEICFRPDADPRQRSAIRDAMRRSPRIERMLEGKEAEAAVYGAPADRPGVR